MSGRYSLVLTVLLALAACDRVWSYAGASADSAMAVDVATSDGITADGGGDVVLPGDAPGDSPGDVPADVLAKDSQPEGPADQGPDAAELLLTDKLQVQTKGSSDPDDSRAPHGVFTVQAILTNVSTDALASLRCVVIQLRAGDKLLNADGGPAGVGAVVSIPDASLGADGILSPGESFEQVFEIGLFSPASPFDFFVDFYGLPVPP